METTDSDTLLAQLKAERQAEKSAQIQLANLDRQIALANSQLDRVRGIDPEKYQELLTRQRQIADEELRQNQDWDALKNDYKNQEGELNSQIQTWQSKYKGLLAKQAIKDAFVSAGGITKSQDGENSPLDFVTQYFVDRVQVEDDKITLLDRAGNPESVSLTEKMAQIKHGSMGSLFQSDSKRSTLSQSRSATSHLIVYTQEQARLGKADMKKIANGQAIIR